MANISLNEALGRRESELLSSVVGQEIEITGVEIETGKDKDGKEYQRAYFNTVNGVSYRSSNKAILPKAESIAKNMKTGQTLKVRVVEKKVKKGVGKFIDFEEVK